MRIKVFSCFGLLMVLLSGWLTLLWAGVDFYWLDYTRSRNVVDLPQEESVAPGTDCAVPRNQVLLEVITGTW
jgi:hypothetical protein